MCGLHWGELIAQSTSSTSSAATSRSDASSPATCCSRPREGTPISRNTFRTRVWRPAVAASGIDFDVRVHDLRHAHASWLLAGGSHLKSVMDRMGHAQITTTQKYLHTLPVADTKNLNALTASANLHPGRRRSPPDKAKQVGLDPSSAPASPNGHPTPKHSGVSVPTSPLSRHSGPERCGLNAGPAGSLSLESGCEPRCVGWAGPHVTTRRRRRRRQETSPKVGLTGNTERRQRRSRVSLSKGPGHVEPHWTEQAASHSSGGGGRPPVSCRRR